jgi:ATP-binding protein involved in chromosome partitioning
MAQQPLTEAAIRDVAGQLIDPESGRSVSAMDQLGEVRLSGNDVTLTLALSTHSAPLWNATRQELIDLLRARFPQMGQIDVRLTVHPRPPQKIGQIGLTAKSVIAVGSGKGGVGKSTIAAGLALGLARAGSQVGLMDADVYGPSIPHLLGVSQRPAVADNKIQPIETAGLKMMSMGLLVAPGEAVIWRGPMLHGAITQFLRDTLWGELDYLIIDMPPGTGDIALTLSQLLPLTGAVVVCTPQDVALLDAVKAVAMFRKVSIPVLGMVENMSGFVCPDCGKRYDIFGSGGAKKRAAELGIPFLGEVPITMQIRVLGDLGQSAAALDDPNAAPYLNALVERLVRNLADSRRESPPLPTLSVLG